MSHLRHKGSLNHQDVPQHQQNPKRSLGELALPPTKTPVRKYDEIGDTAWLGCAVSQIYLNSAETVQCSKSFSLVCMITEKTMSTPGILQCQSRIQKDTKGPFLIGIRSGVKRMLRSEFSFKMSTNSLHKSPNTTPNIKWKWALRLEIFRTS